MIRVLFRFNFPDGGSEGWNIDLQTLPRIGEEIIIHLHEDIPLRGRVKDVRHIAFAYSRDFQATISQVELHVEVNEHATSI